MRRADFLAALSAPLPLDPGKDTFQRGGALRTQQEHWRWWLEGHRCDDATLIYNRIQDPGMLAWLARALALRLVVTDAVDGLAADRTRAAQLRCAEIRALVPWRDIEARLLAPAVRLEIVQCSNCSVEMTVADPWTELRGWLVRSAPHGQRGDDDRLMIEAECPACRMGRNAADAVLLYDLLRFARDHFTDENGLRLSDEEDGRVQGWIDLLSPT
jgi:hypothetical protein